MPTTRHFLASTFAAALRGCAGTALGSTASASAGHLGLAPTFPKGD